MTTIGDDGVFGSWQSSALRMSRESVAVTEQTSVLDHWQASVSRSFVPLIVKAGADSLFHARLEGRVCDGVFFSTIWATPHTVIRDNAHVRAASSDYLELTVLQSGSASLVQDGRMATLEVGDIVLHDMSRPYTLEFEKPMSAVFVMFPYDIISMDRHILSSLTAVRLSRTSFARTVGQFLRSIPEALQDLDQATSTRLTHNALDLIQTMVGHELADADNPDPSAELMMRIDHYINTHLGMHDLSPTVVADANFISTRHLHALFQRRGITVSKLIKQRQLEHARRDLIDPMRRHESISTIAGSWGFPVAAQFSKAFRAYVGTSPSKYRAMTS